VTVEILTSDGATVLGTATLQGVRVQQPDGSIYVPRADGRPVPFNCTCNPRQLLTSEDVRTLAGQLGRGLAGGELPDGRQWRA
jgi:hypothetical protein